MNRDLTRRLSALEQSQPPKPQRVVIIGEYDEEPNDADFVIRLVPAVFEEKRP